MSRTIDRRPTNPLTCGSGFTLIEVLIVMGIIALLAALLLPALRRVQGAAQQIKCANNVREIWVALRNYASDNKDTFPTPSQESPQTGPQYVFSCTGKGMIDYNVGCLWRYIGPGFQTRWGVMNCPTDLVLGDARVVDNSNTVHFRNFTYSFNCYFLASKNGLGHNLRVLDIVKPTQKVIVVEESYPNDPYALVGVIPFNSIDVPSIRHDGRGNQGFADGHVECVYPLDVGYMNDLSGFSDPNGVAQQSYWNPLVP
jgi:prepilin-type N-terminal cleavage/methylation domain-containing protein/prepilin-type processing-associated H-X9-DG protein